MDDSWAHEVGPNRVELIDIGEGSNGDFDPTNPADEPLLCLDHFERGADGQWKLIDEKFSRTKLPVTATAEMRVTALTRAMARVLGTDVPSDDQSYIEVAKRSSGPSCSM
jgi:hypothetical protein